MNDLVPVEAGVAVASIDPATDQGRLSSRLGQIEKVRSDLNHGAGGADTIGGGAGDDVLNGGPGDQAPPSSPANWRWGSV